MILGNGNKREPWKLIKHSYHKLWALFSNGQTLHRYSIDWKHSLSLHRDPAIGFARFRKLVKKWNPPPILIIIYEVKTGKPIAKYYKGQEIEIFEDP